MNVNIPPTPIEFIMGCRNDTVTAAKAHRTILLDACATTGA